MYGFVLLIGYMVLMAIPLLVVIGSPSISTGATVAVYAAGIIADTIALIVLVVLTLSYANRAARGQLFAIPLISTMADRLFRLRR